MLWNAKNGTLKLGDMEMDYIRFGRGERDLIILPGLGDGLQTVRGTALPMAAMYRCFAKDFTVWGFSRRRELPGGYTTRDMAKDQARAMTALGIEKADVFAVSMGGMIAQYLAIDHPEMVGDLILAVTCSGPNAVLHESVGEWMDCVERDDHRALLDSNVRRIYSPDYYRKNRWLVPIMGALTKPKSYDRFRIQAEACLGHDAAAQLHRIRSRTLVIGGGRDIALGPEASAELASAIPGAELKMYEKWGHGVYEEEKTFNRTVLAFLRGERI